MKNLIILLCLLSMIGVWGILHQPAGIMTDYEIKFWDNKEPQAQIINDRFHLDQEPALLYLDPGDAPYFFRANSSCRYVAPLPIQRDAPGWNLTDLPQYWEEYNCIMNYNGRYIVFDAGNHYDGVTDWFSESYSHRLPIMQKIHSEYRLVYNGSWRIYQRIPALKDPLMPLLFNASTGSHYVRLRFTGDNNTPVMSIRGYVDDKIIEEIDSDLFPGNTIPLEGYSFFGNTSVGSIDVPMIRPLRYVIDVSNASYGYSHRYWIYPRENEYTFHLV